MEQPPHPVDVQVGQALRRERKAAGWSQQALADKLDVTFQQLQKYERGANRISASKLFQACQALGLRPSALFGVVDPSDDEGLSPEEIRFLAAIRRLPPPQRRTLLDAAEALQSQLSPTPAP